MNTVFAHYKPFSTTTVALQKKKSPLFTGSGPSSLRAKTTDQLANIGTEAATKIFTEEYLKKLLLTSEAKKVLKETFDPQYVKALMESGDVKGNIEALLTEQYLTRLLETSKAKKVLKDAVTPQYVKEFMESSDIKGLATEQITTILKSPIFQQETKESIKTVLSGMLQEAIQPVCQISIGTASILMSQQQENESLKTALQTVGGHNIASGTHTLLGFKNAPQSKTALGITSLIASQYFLPEQFQLPTQLLGTFSLISGLIERYGPKSGWGQVGTGAAGLAATGPLGGIPLQASLASIVHGVSTLWSNPQKVLDKPKLSKAVDKDTIEIQGKSKKAPTVRVSNPQQQKTKTTTPVPEEDYEQSVAEAKTLLEQHAEKTRKAKQDALEKHYTSDQLKLIHAIADGNSYEIENILSKGVDPNTVNLNGKTLLYIAAKENDKQTVKALLKAGVNLEIADSDGQTPLHIAAAYGHKEIFKALLDAGADHTKKDNDDRSPTYFLYTNRWIHYDASLEMFNEVLRRVGQPTRADF